MVNCSSGNHIKVAGDAGFSDRREYRYYNKETRGLDLNGMLEDLQVDTKMLGRDAVYL
jgi:aspartate/tyrosine/aromatic aminotransferase